MTLLAHEELVQLVKEGVIGGVKPEQINATSIDITLGDTLMVEAVQPYGMQRAISLKRRKPLITHEYKLSDDTPFVLMPGQFVLAQSEQIFNLPNYISAEYKLKSSMARIGLEHLNAGWCDAGWNGSVLTLELKNMTQGHPIILDKGVGIGQIVFFKHSIVPDKASYATRGRYNNDTTVKGIKA